MASTAIPKKPTSRFAAGIFPAQMDDAAIAPLLSRAHLLKTRGQWDEAVAVCTDAVRRSPVSPSPYALLGDIYHAQSKGDDALHWYRMALERNPNLPGVAEKYDALFAAKRATATGSFLAAALADKTAHLPAAKYPGVAASPAPTAERVTADRTMEWLDRVFPPGRSEGMTRLLLAVSAVIGLLVVVGGAFLFWSLRQTDYEGGDAAQNAILQPAGEPDTTDVPVRGTLTPPPASAVVAPNVADAGATPTPSLKDRLVAQSGETYTVTAAQANLQNKQVQLEIMLPFLSGEAQDGIRNRVLLTGAKAAEAAFLAEPTAQRFLVRVVLAARPTSTNNPPGGSLVFVGETSAVALHTLRTTSPVPDNALLTASFTQVWWANGLRIAAQ